MSDADADAARLDGSARGHAGDLAGAASAFVSAAGLYRQRGEADELVEVLCDAAEVLMQLGDPQATARAQEAVGVLRERAMLGEGAVPSQQAVRALLTLGMAELRAGDPAAIEALDAAVDAARSLAAALPTDINRARLATALNQESVAARSAGRLDDSVAAASEAVEIHRELATADPGRFAAPLGSALNNLAGAQAMRQELEAAAASAEEACRVLDPLVEAGDLGAAPNLAAAQNNAASFLGDLGQLELAVAFGNEAIEGYQRLARRHAPPAFRPELAKSLVMLATCVVNLDEPEAAAGLCHSATAVLVEHADLLSPPDLAFLADSVRHYLAFAQMSDADLDAPLLDAARSALARL